jgi:hypothetical protein
MLQNIFPFCFNIDILYVTFYELIHNHLKVWKGVKAAAGTFLLFLE